MIAVLALLNRASAEEVSDDSRVLDELVAASEIPPQIRFVGGIARTASVDVATSGWDPESRARDFLTRFAPLFGVEDPHTELVLDRQTTDGAMTHLRFLQRHQGYRVEGGELAVHLIGERVSSVNGHLLPALGPVGVPLLERAEAEKVAIERSELLFAEVLGFPSLVVVPVDGEGHLAWQIQVAGATESGSPSHLQLAIDTRDGAVLDTISRIRDLQLEVYTGWNKDFLGCHSYGVPTLWFDEAGQVSAYDPMLDTNQDALHAFGAARDIYDWFDLEVGRTSFDDQDAPIVVQVHAGKNFENALFNPGCDQIWFGDGYARLDVFTHEFTHAVDDADGSMGAMNQPGALAESFADVFAALVDSDDSRIGDEAPGMCRDMAHPPNCSQPDHLAGYWQLDPGEVASCNLTSGNDCGWIHMNSGIPNKAAWLLMEGGTHRGFVVTAIGRTKVRDLYYSVLTQSLTSQADFVDVRNLLVARAQALVTTQSSGFTSANVCAVKNAFASVGVSPNGADVDCNGIDDFLEADDDSDGTPNVEDNCPTIANWNQLDVDEDLVGNLCDPDIDDDGLLNAADNCAYVSNVDQADFDRDGRGDRCDDFDGDGTVDVDDNCPIDANWDQKDLNVDGEGDVCDEDDDGDRFPDVVDVCPRIADDQADYDRDGRGDACDNCVYVANSGQEDCDGDGIGAACDNTFDHLCDLELPFAIQGWLHPLDLVSIPIGDLRTLVPEGWEVSVYATTGDGTPLRIVDDRGDQVALIGEDGATFEPSASALFEIDGEPGSFKTYYVEVGESVSDKEVEVELSVDFGL